MPAVLHLRREKRDTILQRSFSVQPWLRSMIKRITTTLCDSCPHCPAEQPVLEMPHHRHSSKRRPAKPCSEPGTGGKVLNAAECQRFMLAQHNTGEPLASWAWLSTGERQCQQGCEATPLLQFVEFLYCCLGQVLIPTLFFLDLYYKISEYPLNCHSRISESFRLNS